MPELPEVEIVRQSLLKNIKGKKINKVLIRNRNLRFKLETSFENRLKNKFISNIKRFSKYLVIELENKSFCLIHLGMSGTIHIIKNKKNKRPTNTSFYSSPNLPKNHNHVEFLFKNMKLIYNDPRRFGYFQFLNDIASLKKKLKNLGPEPFNKKFNSKYLINHFKKKDKNIKNFLLDQKFVSGIGNIYASEILYLSKINPSLSAKYLKKNHCKNLVINSRKILQNAIRKGGSSIRDFKNTQGDKGNFQKEFKVYGRDKKNCKRSGCSGIINKITQSNRSTFLCEICQK